jgi:hypothetical protein
MRAWLYDLVCSDEALWPLIGVEDFAGAELHVTPRRGEESINLPKPFLVYGLGNATNEELADDDANDHEAERQFFQVWIHDEGGDYGLIEQIIPVVKRRLIGASDVNSKVVTIRYLETSAEFSNATYNTIFRYIRFQAIIAKSGAAA